MIMESIDEVHYVMCLRLGGVRRHQPEVFDPGDKTIARKAESLTECKWGNKVVIRGLPKVLDTPPNQTLGQQDSHALFATRAW